jgi:hypothetical protein
VNRKKIPDAKMYVSKVVQRGPPVSPTLVLMVALPGVPKRVREGAGGDLGGAASGRLSGLTMAQRKKILRLVVLTTSTSPSLFIVSSQADLRLRK